LQQRLKPIPWKAKNMPGRHGDSALRVYFGIVLSYSVSRAIHAHFMALEASLSRPAEFKS
jgi:hypothetical protein